MKKYFAYIRVSTTKQGEQGSSLQEQRSAIEAYAARHNLRIIDWFEEQETAASQGRPIFGTMLKAIERKVADGVITHKIDRSARNLRDWARIGELIDRGVEMHFAHESIDLTSRGGRLSADILAVVASDYIRNLRDEVRKGFYGRLKQGLYPLGAPLGYLDQGGGKPKTIDPIRGALIKQAFELYATGLWTLHTLRDALHARGLRNRRGGRVTITGLSTILNNPFYTGIIKLRKTRQVFEGVHEPLIEPKLFEEVADVLTGRTPKRGPRNRYRYQRMLRCQACGYALTAERQKGHLYYRCHTRGCTGACVREEQINAAVFGDAARLSLTPEQWKAIERDVDALLEARASDAPRERERITLQLAALEDRITRTTDAFVDNVLDKETYATRKEQLFSERLKLRAALGNVDAGHLSERQYLRKIFELGIALHSFTESAHDDKIREVLGEATSNLVVAGKNVVIYWRKPLQQMLAVPSFFLGGPNRGDLRTKDLAKIISDLAVESRMQDGTQVNDRMPSRELPRPDDNDDPWPYDLDRSHHA
ncbi:MAG: recombinase family protein [Reyranellaceae bacterium]